jgi:hypothetical protein
MAGDSVAEHDENQRYPTRPDFDSGPGDYGLTALKAAASLVPVMGGPLAELVDLIAPPVQRRRDTFLLALADDVRRMRDEGVNVEKLFSDEAFVSTLLHTIQIAQRSHQQEKLEALRNAVRNSASESAPDSDVRMMFLSFVDSFTVWHLRALQYYRVKRRHKYSPVEFLNNDARPPNPPLWKIFPKLEKPFAEQVVRDLLDRGLLSSRFAVTVITPLGQQFLDFVSNAASNQGRSISGAPKP